MTVGSIVHELFQIILRQRLTTREQIEAASEKMLCDGGMAYTLYASNMNSAEARSEFKNFLDKIYDFMQRYIEGKVFADGKKVGRISLESQFNRIYHNFCSLPKTNEFTGQIDDIKDIEENIWIPKLGLKGKVDVSVKVQRSRNGASKTKSLYMPLELKTGRASFSAEHTGQLIIYQMMMSEVEQTTIDSGLLLYLRDGVMREINGTHNERRDLILLRNEISYYLAKQYESYNKIGRKSLNDEKTDEDLVTELLHTSNIPELPEPINRANVCSTCPYNVLCSVYLNQNMEMMSTLGSKHPLREISTLVTSHLTDTHIHYFCHWVGLMVLEDQESKKSM